MIVANPIYDIVFKYLMEDERITRTILSALLDAGKPEEEIAQSLGQDLQTIRRQDVVS